MNLMFRKHFRESGGGKGSVGGSKLQSNVNRTKRSRDIGLLQTEDLHYRTHLFFSPNRTGYDDSEERCTAFSGACIQLSTTTASLPLLPLPHEVDAPQPLVDRKSPVSLVNWNNVIVRNDQLGTPILSTTMATTTTYAARQVSFGIDGRSSDNNIPSATHGEPISLAILNRDCFLIPVHNIERFLPAGIPIPAFSIDGNVKTGTPLTILEVADPNLCILVHLMSPLEPIDHVMETPLSDPFLKQRTLAAELVTEVQNTNNAVGGMLLANMEKCVEFPFITYYLLNTIQTDPSSFYTSMRVSTLSKFEPKTLK